MKKLLLLSAFCCFAQVKTEESDFPEMTDEQRHEIEGMKKHIDKYLQIELFRDACQQLISKGKAIGLLYSSGKISKNGVDSHSCSIKNNDESFNLEITLNDSEIHSIHALNRMLINDCPSGLNLSNIKACTALRDILRDTQLMDDSPYYQMLDFNVKSFSK